MADIQTQVEVMRENLEIMTEAVFAGLTTFVSEDNQIKAKALVIKLAHEYKPYYLLHPDSITELETLIFADAIHSDFIWNVTFQFYAMIGSDTERLRALLANLASGIDICPEFDNTLTDRVLVPDELQGRINAAGNHLEYLMANKWLVVIILIQLVYPRIREEFTLEKRRTK